MQKIPDPTLTLVEDAFQYVGKTTRHIWEHAFKESYSRTSFLHRAKCHHCDAVMTIFFDDKHKTVYLKSRVIYPSRVGDLAAEKFYPFQSQLCPRLEVMR